MLLASSEALAEHVTQEHFDDGLILPTLHQYSKDFRAHCCQGGSQSHTNSVWRVGFLDRKTWWRMPRVACTALVNETTSATTPLLGYDGIKSVLDGFQVFQAYMNQAYE